MSEPQCKECKKLFTEQGINRVKRTNICGKCHYQKQKVRDLKNAIKNSGITEQVCNKCGILKPIKEYKKGHKKCKQCPVKKRKPLDYTNLFCKDCGEKLTPHTKTSGKRQCKYCTNLYQRNRVKKAKESGVTKKTCRKCARIKPIKIKEIKPYTIKYKALFLLFVVSNNHFIFFTFSR